MRPWCTASLCVAALLIATPGHADIKRVAYPQVKVDVAAAVAPEPAFMAFWEQLGGAVARRDANALFALVAPSFVWTAQGSLTAEFDPGRNALHNFKVVFGFRQQGRDEDGGVEGGPYWDALAQFVGDPAFYSASDKTGLICGPLLAEVADGAALERAQQALTIGDDSGSWYFVAGETPVAKKPGDAGAALATISKVAFPVLGTYPPEQSGVATTPTHYEVLLPSGASGWIPANAARPLANDRLCYAKTRDGAWTIAIFDQGQADD